VRNAAVPAALRTEDLVTAAMNQIVRSSGIIGSSWPD
jgi:hypothetical protein